MSNRKKKVVRKKGEKKNKKPKLEEFIKNRDYTGELLCFASLAVLDNFRTLYIIVHSQCTYIYAKNMFGLSWASPFNIAHSHHSSPVSLPISYLNLCLSYGRYGFLFFTVVFRYS